MRPKIKPPSQILLSSSPTSGEQRGGEGCSLPAAQLNGHSFRKIFRFSESIQIFRKCSDFQKSFRLLGKKTDFSMENTRTFREQPQSQSQLMKFICKICLSPMQEGGGADVI